MLPIIGCAGFVNCLETHEGLHCFKYSKCASLYIMSSWLQQEDFVTQFFKNEMFLQRNECVQQMLLERIPWGCLVNSDDVKAGMALRLDPD